MIMPLSAITYEDISKFWKVCSCYDPDEKRTLYFLEAYDSDKLPPRFYNGGAYITEELATKFIEHELHSRVEPLKCGILFRKNDLLLKNAKEIKTKKAHLRVFYTYRLRKAKNEKNSL